ncbi:MAG: ATP-binding protein [Gammaproteobacteria bacterium]
MASPGTPALALCFCADPAELKTVRDKVRDVLVQAGADAKTAADVVIAVNEACMNIIQHAYKGDCSGEISLRIHNNGGQIEIELQDRAAPVDCSSIKPRPIEELRPGGLGTYFIQEIMDDCVYGNLQDGAGNFLRMTKRVGPPARQRRS